MILLGYMKICFKLISSSDIDKFHDLLVLDSITVHKILKKNEAIDHDRCIKDDNDSISKSSKYNDV